MKSIHKREKQDTVFPRLELTPQNAPPNTMFS